MSFLQISLNLVNEKLYKLDWQEQTYPVLMERYKLERAKQEITDLLKEGK